MRQGATPEQREALEAQMWAIAGCVADGSSIQDAARKIGIERNRACRVWRKVRERLGAQAV
jgi:hypothetical protein